MEKNAYELGVQLALQDVGILEKTADVGDWLPYLLVPGLLAAGAGGRSAYRAIKGIKKLPKSKSFEAYQQAGRGLNRPPKTPRYYRGQRISGGSSPSYSSFQQTRKNIR